MKSLVLDFTIICLLGFQVNLTWHYSIILKLSLEYQATSLCHLALAVLFTVLEVSHIGRLVFVIVKSAFAVH